MGKDIQNQSINKWRIIQFATEFGFIIALPLVGLGLVGKWVDRKMDSDPWFTLAGILLAIALTTIWITRRVKELMKR